MNIFGYRFTITKLHRKRSKNKLGARRWSESETNTLLRMHDEGKNADEIAELLNRTLPSIYSRLAKVKI